MAITSKLSARVKVADLADRALHPNLEAMMTVAQPLTFYGTTFESRMLIGTALYASPDILSQSVKSLGGDPVRFIMSSIGTIRQAAR